MEVAVADVADDRAGEAGARRGPRASQDHSASAEIGTQASVVERARPGTQRARGVVGAVAGVPQLAAARASSVAQREALRAVLGGDLLGLGGLRRDLRRRAVELEEQRRRDAVVQFVGGG